MAMYEEIKHRIKDAILARDYQTKQVLVTLIAEIEANSVDNNKRRITPTDEIVSDVSLKFYNNANEFQMLLDADSPKHEELDFAINIYNQFILPAISEQEINQWLTNNAELIKGKPVGPVVGLLKKHFGKALDGNLAKTCVEHLK